MIDVSFRFICRIWLFIVPRTWLQLCVCTTHFSVFRGLCNSNKRKKNNKKQQQTHKYVVYPYKSQAMMFFWKLRIKQDFFLWDKAFNDFITFWNMNWRMKCNNNDIFFLAWLSLRVCCWKFLFSLSVSPSLYCLISDCIWVSQKRSMFYDQR